MISRLAVSRGGRNVAAAVNVGSPNTTTQVVTVMTDDPESHDNQITEDELEEQQAEALPERTQMSVVLPGPPGITLPIMPPDVSDL